MDGIPGAAERVVTRAVGEELRRARGAISRAELVDRMFTGIRERTYATYEHGSRQCTVARFVEICDALDVPAPRVLELALQRAAVQLDAISLQVDLHAVVRDSRAELKELRKWAHNRLEAFPEGSGIVRLTKAVIQEMAMFFGFGLAELMDHLVMFAPESVTTQF